MEYLLWLVTLFLLLAWLITSIVKIKKELENLRQDIKMLIIALGALRIEQENQRLGLPGEYVAPKGFWRYK